MLGAMLASVLFASLTLAAEFTTGQHNNFIQGVRGNQGIRTNPATVNGVAFIHLGQLFLDANGNFIGVGTYKGRNTVGGTTNCPSHYGGDWTGYYDRVVAMVYACSDFCVDCWDTGDNPSFKIEWASCLPQPVSRWVVTFAGTNRACISGPSSGIGGSAGLEVVGTTNDYNIDAKWTNMQQRPQGGTFWGCYDSRPGQEAPDYTYQYVNTTVLGTRTSLR